MPTGEPLLPLALRAQTPFLIQVDTAIRRQPIAGRRAGLARNQRASGMKSTGAVRLAVEAELERHLARRIGVRHGQVRAPPNLSRCYGSEFNRKPVSAWSFAH